jgi:CHAD domain-containing protein
MAYRLKLQSSLGKDVKRILLSQIDRAYDELSSETVSAKNIHEARKSLKRTRSLLRLVAMALPVKTRRQEIARFRDIAAMLAPLRDRQILMDTADQLLAHAHDDAHRHAIETLKSFLDSSDAIGTGTHDSRAAIANARSALAKAHKPIEKLKLKQIKRATLIEGLTAMYRKGRAAGRHAKSHPSDETFHEARKAVQHHARQLQLIAPLWPDLFNVKVSAARHLAQTLGDDHDLSILVSFVSSQPGALLSDEVKAQVIAAARIRQNELRAGSARQHQITYAMRPKDIERFIAALWAAGATPSNSKAKGAAKPAASPAAQSPGPAPPTPH